MPTSRRIFNGSVLFGMQASDASDLLASAVHTDILSIQDRILSSIGESFPIQWIPQFIYQSLVNELIQLGTSVTSAMQLLANDASLAYPRFLGMQRRTFSEGAVSDLSNSRPAVFDEVEFDEEDDEENILFPFLPLSNSDILLIFALALFANQTPAALWNGSVSSRAIAVRNRLNSTLGQVASLGDQSQQARVALIQEARRSIAGGQGIKPYRESVAVASSILTRTTTLAVLQQVAKQIAVNANVEIFTWSAILDGRTCLRCLNLNGKQFEAINGEVRGPQVPLHFLCRCLYVPEVEFAANESSVRSKPKRPKRNIDLTFEEWFRTLPASAQLRILGKDRLELYLSGELKLRSFVEFRNQVPVRIKQLNELRGAA